MAIKIFVDQGHNPQNPNAGAEVNGVREQDINYEVGVRLAALLRADPDFEANTWGADYFVSLHCNTSTNTSASGSEAYVYSESTPAYTLAGRILEGLHDMTGLRNRGVFIRPSLYVLRATSMPAVLVEMGYMTNANDLYLLISDPESFARGIYRGICLYFGMTS